MTASRDAGGKGYLYEQRTGNTRRIIRKAKNDPVYHGLGLTYDRSEPLWLATWDHWEVEDDQPINHQIDEPAREFRYGSGRGRYLVRDRWPQRVAFLS